MRPKGAGINNKRPSYHSRNAEGFRDSVPAARDKDQMCALYYTTGFNYDQGFGNVCLVSWTFTALVLAVDMAGLGVISLHRSGSSSLRGGCILGQDRCKRKNTDGWQPLTFILKA